MDIGPEDERFRIHVWARGSSIVVRHIPFLYVKIASVLELLLI
jgi:hypothetical protein